MARRAVSSRPPSAGSAASSIPAPASPEAIAPEPPADPFAEPALDGAVPPLASVDLLTSAALAQLADENAALREQVAEMAAAMAKLRRQVLEASEGELVKLALAIAERVVSRELATDPALIAAWAREAIQSLAAKDEVVIAVAKDVSQRVPSEAWEMTGVDLCVQSDSQLEAGSVEVRTREGIIATGPAARIAAVSTALGLGES